MKSAPARARPLPAALRLLLVSDGRGDRARLVDVVAAAVRGGLRAVLVRERTMGARELGATCEVLRGILHPVQGLVLVSDRADVAAAGHADGVHLGHRSLPAAEVRRFLPEDRWLGVSAHGPEDITAAHAGGADYVTLSPVFATASHPETEPLGAERAARWSVAAPLPVLWLGGIVAARAPEVLARQPAGVAFLGAVFAAADPEATARELVRTFGAGLAPCEAQA